MASMPLKRSHLGTGSGFIQIARDRRDAWLGLFYGSPCAAKLWTFLFMASDRRNEVHLSERTIKISTGLSTRSLYRAYQVLEERRFIERNNGRIFLNAALIWRGSLDAKITARLFCDPVSVDKPKKSRKKPPAAKLAIVA